MEQETLGLMPWTHALDRSEREQFLELSARCPRPWRPHRYRPAASTPEREVTGTTGVTAPVAH